MTVRSHLVKRQFPGELAMKRRKMLPCLCSFGLFSFTPLVASSLPPQNIQKPDRVFIGSFAFEPGQRDGHCYAQKQWLSWPLCS